MADISVSSSIQNCSKIREGGREGGLPHRPEIFSLSLFSAHCDRRHRPSVDFSLSQLPLVFIADADYDNRPRRRPATNERPSIRQNLANFADYRREDSKNALPWTGEGWDVLTPLSEAKWDFSCAPRAAEQRPRIEAIGKVQFGNGEYVISANFIHPSGQLPKSDPSSLRPSNRPFAPHEKRKRQRDAADRKKQRTDILGWR